MSAPPSYSKPEIERRWLVPADSQLGANAERMRELEDRYIEGTRLRLRKVTESGRATIYKLGKKYEAEVTGVHHSVSTYLSEAEYKVLLVLPARRSKKRRLSVCGGALDVYELPNPGLQVFEVEFSTTEEAVAYVPPQGICQEVTSELTFTGYALAGAA
jgi:CYTH domain-containing protein